MNQASAFARYTRGIAVHPAHERRMSAAGAVGPTATPIMLLLDARGNVRFCSDADALQRAEGDIAGRPVGELIDGLPLRQGTPGYNVAYVRFAYGDGTRRRLALKLPEGGSRPIDVGVRPLWMDRGYCLLVQVRFASDPTSPAVEPVPLVRRQPVAAEEVCC